MEKKFNYIASAKRTLKIGSDSILGITKQLNKSFTNLCDEIITVQSFLWLFYENAKKKIKPCPSKMISNIVSSIDNELHSQLNPIID